MTSRLRAVAFGAGDPDRIGRFWAGLLDRDVHAEDDGVLLPGDDTQVGIRFVRRPGGRRGAERMHLHVTSEGSDLETVVAAALALGAGHLDVGQRAEEPHVVLGDPEGTAFCVIPPDNAFLAGCGALGEVACEGSRAVGTFWSEVLGWALVWDRDEETATQSPYGGTKLAWGGPPVPPPVVPAHQWFELETDDDLDVEVGRLVSLGASPASESGAPVVVMTDPDGQELRLRRGRVLRR